MKNKRIIAAVTAVLMAGSAFSAQLTVGAEDNSVSNITVNNINNKEAVTKDGVIYHLFYDYAAAAYRLTDEYEYAEEPTLSSPSTRSSSASAQRKQVLSLPLRSTVLSAVLALLLLRQLQSAVLFPLSRSV